MSKTEARQAGRDAYHAGDTPHCPYARGASGGGATQNRNMLRVAWYDGYYEARLADKLPKHFTLEPLTTKG